MTLLGVYRERAFSPGKVREDATILDATLEALSRQGYEVHALEAETLDGVPPRPSCALSMAQSDRALKILESWDARGTRVVNAVQSVRNCYRQALIRLLTEAGIPVPQSQIIPLEEAERTISLGSSIPYWVKRGDVHAMQSADVVKVSSGEELARALDHFRTQKVETILVQHHVEGEVIKFYGVGCSDYFSAFLVSTGEEITDQMRALAALARQSADAVGLEVYGGDAVITPEHQAVLIDLNDWPSFSRCSQAAPKAIARYVTRVCDGGFHGASRE